jgi:hypothetical protein
MPDNKKRLSLFIGLTTALLLSGCATNQTLPVDKVVLDWKDFYPTSFTAFDSCNTFRTDIKGTKYQKNLCFIDRGSAVEDQYAVNIKIIKYDPYSQYWKDLTSHLSEQEKNQNRVLSDALFRISKTVCKGSYLPIGRHGFRCTPNDSPEQDILIVYNFLKSSSGQWVEATASHAIEKNKAITESSWQYQTAKRVISQENLKQFL